MVNKEDPRLVVRLGIEDSPGVPVVGARIFGTSFEQGIHRLTTDAKEHPLGYMSHTVTFDVHPSHKVVTCCGCGFPVDQNNPRSLVMDPDAYMGTYGPCCAPRGQKLAGARRRWERIRRDR